ncbi:LytTR family transcriptional regulator DNA-binding domain-containing protein [Solibacillus sp. CAU 1738]|uniref:LytTR family transcriptional regulator DNA-binding domain-containing protein n=1 Tax=Solibacillus sp. CAU 1738 TaxID=3140363 RepID=UPI00326041BC
MPTCDIEIAPYIEAGNIICPKLSIAFKENYITGIYTDRAKMHYLLSVLQKDGNAYVHLKEDQLYERLKVSEIVTFYKKLYGTTKSVDELLQRLSLTERKHLKINKLSNSEQQLLHYIKVCATPASLIVIEEPLQNLEDHTKQIIINLLGSLSQKMIVLLSNNLEDLITSCNEINRLDTQGLHALDIAEQEELNTETTTFTPIKIEKIPTKKNDKIILFNPPEVDYIESIEGDVFVYVAGESYPCTLTLTELENRLVPLGFFRCHRSYIVNLQKVREIITWTKNSYSLSIHTTTKTVVPLSKNKLAMLKELIGI